MAEVKRIESRVTYTAAAVESALGEIAATPLYRILDLNSYSDAATTSDTTTREVMSAGRQLLKGAQTGRSTNFGYAIDNTIDNTIAQVCSFLYRRPVEKGTSRSVLAASLASGAAITALTASTITVAGANAYLAVGDLLVVSDGTNDRTLLKATAVTATDITASPVFVGEQLSVVNAVPKHARVIKVGTALAATTTIQGYVDRVEIKGAGVDFTTLKLMVGEWIFVGDELTNVPTVEPFYGRISKITADTITLDTTTRPIPTSVTTYANGVNLYMGTFIYNGDETISLQHARYLGTNTGDKEMVETFIGCVANELAINASERSLLNMDLGYMCLDSDAAEMTKQDFATNIVANSLPAYEQDPINTSTDVVRQRLYVPKVGQMNTAAIHSFVQDATVNISNNVAEDTAMGHIAAVGMTAGDFTVTGSITAYFNDLTAMRAVKCNCTVGMDMIYARKNSGIVIDIPALTLATNGVTIEKGAAIKIPLDQAAFKSHFGFTLGYTVFHYLPDAAMPLVGCDC